MKKSSLESLVHYLSEKNDDCMMDIKAEIEAELSKGAEEKAARAAAYEEMHDLIVGSLSDTPVTCAELYENIANELATGTTKNKVQYALTHLWQDEIVVIRGKPNTYKRA